MTIVNPETGFVVIGHIEPAIGTPEVEIIGEGKTPKAVEIVLNTVVKEYARISVKERATGAVYTSDDFRKKFFLKAA